MNSDAEHSPPRFSVNIVGFLIGCDTKCAECGEELGEGHRLREARAS